MTRFVVIGLGRFGSWVAHSLHKRGFDVIAIERDADLADRFADQVTRLVVGDGSDPEVLRNVGAEAADAAIVSTGTDLAASILAVLALKEIGVADIYVKVSSLRHAEAIRRFDVREMIFPEQEAADRLAHRLASTSVLDYVRLADGYSIQEMAIPDSWLGRTLKDLALPRRQGVQVVALHDVLTGQWNVVPDPEEPLKESDIAILVGHDDTLAELTRSVSGRG